MSSGDLPARTASVKDAIPRSSNHSRQMFQEAQSNMRPRYLSRVSLRVRNLLVSVGRSLTSRASRALQASQNSLEAWVNERAASG